MKAPYLKWLTLISHLPPTTQKKNKNAQEASVWTRTLFFQLL